MNDILIALAKAAILVALNQPENFDLEDALQTYPILKENGAVFVTINTKHNDQLRGCMGSLQAYRPLYKDIILNAQAAALRDSRFPPLTVAELKHIKLEVSILSEPKVLAYHDKKDLESKVVPLQDGIILKYNGKQATYLPHVWEDLPKFDDFFSSLCLKANLGNDCLSEHPEISIYQVKNYKEGEMMNNPIRKAAVRGSFYPQECSQIKAYFEKFNHSFEEITISQEVQNIVPRAVIVPHAGYIYSGFTANFAYRFLKQTKAKRLIVIGPSHHHYFQGISGSYYENYETPCGNIGIDSPYLFALAKQFDIGFEPKAHEKEHSTEVQMPFIQHYFPKSKIIELIYSDTTAKTLAPLITALLQNKDNAVVISSDLSHFHSLEEAKAFDENCLRAVAKLDLNEIQKGCEACGLIGVQAMILAAKQLKLSSKLLDYRTSAETSGDSSSVVGYMSAMFY